MINSAITGKKKKTRIEFLETKLTKISTNLFHFLLNWRRNCDASGPSKRQQCDMYGRKCVEYIGNFRLTYLCAFRNWNFDSHRLRNRKHRKDRYFDSCSGDRTVYGRMIMSSMNVHRWIRRINERGNGINAGILQQGIRNIVLIYGKLYNKSLWCLDCE